MTVWGDGPDELLQRLHTALSSPDQRMFVQSFHMFLDKDEERDMCIDLDDACKFMGILKGNAKKLLVKHFAAGAAFACNIYKCTDSSLDRRERVLMTPDTFKELCMMAGTAKGREVRGYYIKMEKVMKAYFKDKMIAHAAAESRMQLENQRMVEERAAAEAAQQAAEARLAEELEKQKQRVYVPVPTHDHVYVTKEASELHSDRHKVGKALDPKTRVSAFNTGSARSVQELHRRATHNAPIVEDVVAVVMKRYHYAREHYMCSVDHSISIIDVAATVIDTLASCYEHIGRRAMFRRVIDNLNDVAGCDEADESDDDVESVCDEAGADSAMNKLHQFLAMPDDERVDHMAQRVLTVQQDAHAVTTITAFKDAFQAVMGAPLADLDAVTLANFGFTLPNGRVQVCKGCGKQSTPGCCPAYGRQNRKPQRVILGMRMTWDVPQDEHSL